MANAKASSEAASAGSSMIVCSCNVLSDREIRNVATAARVQPLSAHQVYGCLGCNMRCGRCARTVKQILSEALIGAQSLGRPYRLPPAVPNEGARRQTSAALPDFDPITPLRKHDRLFVAQVRTVQGAARWHCVRYVMAITKKRFSLPNCTKITAHS